MAQATTQPTTTTGPRTMATLSSAAVERFPDAPALRHKRTGDWTEVSYAEAGQAIDEIARGLMALGVAPGDRVGLLCETRPEWSYTSLAISSIGAVVVPVYPTNSPKECEWVIGNSEARVCVAEDAGQVQKIAEVREALPALEQVVVIDPDGAEGAIALDELRARGRAEGDADEHARRRDAVEPDDPYTIIYTSGTTGNPKGVVLTHGNAASVCGMVQELEFVEDDDVSYLFLPLAHVFALSVQIGSWHVGAPIVYFGGDAKQIVGELAQTKPTYFPSVPRIFEKIYSLATQAADQGGPEAREQMQGAIKLGVDVRRRLERGEEVPAPLQEAFDAADEKLYRNVRNLFGGQIRQAVTGAAPIAPEIVEFFYGCGVLLLEGWGMTETTAVGCVNRPGAVKFGTIGQAMPGCDVRIAEDGEILIKGPNVFREYWKNPEATAETFTDDGYLKTGDLGEIDGEGFVRISGRKKDIIITAGGKNLTPSNIENELKQSRYISQAVMYADRKPFPVALITLDPEEIVPWAQAQGLPTDVAELTQREEVRALVQQAIDEVNPNHARVAQIKKFFILDHDLSQETGELTPTLKVKRNVVNDKYAEQFEALYS